ncbi:MAG: hypothetical protein GSR78_00610 [Desulfurococcales archaeon]|nr:hypothetical protein [Desulfurococcales archaeon]
MPARRKLSVAVVWYKIEEVTVGNVTIDLLKPVKKFESVEAGSPIDVMLKIAEQNMKSKAGDYFEIIVEGSDELRQIMGEAPSHTRERGEDPEVRPLYRRPARLIRVGVLTGQIGDNPMELDMSKARWHRIRGEYYVFEGRIRAPENVALVVLDTDQGRSIVPLAKSRSGSRQRSGLTPQG